MQTGFSRALESPTWSQADRHKEKLFARFMMGTNINSQQELGTGWEQGSSAPRALGGFSPDSARVLGS